MFGDNLKLSMHSINEMTTYDEYLKNILSKVLESYSKLTQLKDRPGELEIVQRELLTINGFFQVIVNKIGTENYKSDTLLELKSKIKQYLENYYFEREIEIMMPLYSEDPNRIKNIRIKIIDALNDKKLIQRTTEEIDNLDE